ncbi:uncharacterized protein [Cherax quadricarinatus]|uniref:uncharacterized protein isoform X1 n=2 Tax=Cherax quadricarinatus TaxID=27406 RepID=UPI00387E4B1A
MSLLFIVDKYVSSMNDVGVKEEGIASYKTALARDEVGNVIQEFLQAIMPDIMENDALLRLSNEDRTTGLWALARSVLTHLLGTLLLPFLKIIIVTLIAFTLRTLCIALFGERTMARIVGSEGYIYYASIVLSKYIGYGPVTRLQGDFLQQLTGL